MRLSLVLVETVKADSLPLYGGLCDLSGVRVMGGVEGPDPFAWAWMRRESRSAVESMLKTPSQEAGESGGSSRGSRSSVALCKTSSWSSSRVTWGVEAEAFPLVAIPVSSASSYCDAALCQDSLLLPYRSNIPSAMLALSMRDSRPRPEPLRWVTPRNEG